MTITWTPCFSTEDGKAAGLPGRDELMDQWCKQQGGALSGTDYEDCGDWKFKRQCDIPDDGIPVAQAYPVNPDDPYSMPPPVNPEYSGGSGGTPAGWCPPPDCYQNCALQDKERRKACVLINKAHAEKMKAIGCPTSCTTKAVGKACRKKKNPKKCPKKKTGKTKSKSKKR